MHARRVTAMNNDEKVVFSNGDPVMFLCQAKRTLAPPTFCSGPMQEKILIGANETVGEQGADDY